MQRRTLLRCGVGTAIGGALAACGGGTGVSIPGDGGAPAQPVRLKTVGGWTAIALQAVRATRPGPPMAARSFAVLYTCMYNAWCAYDALAQPTRAGQPARRPLAERSAANRAMAMSYAAHTALVDQFPSEKPAFDAYLTSLGYGAAGTPADLGVAAARIEIGFCHADGANQLGDLTPSGVPYADYTGYTPKNPPMLVSVPTPLDVIPAPGNWQPLTYTDAAGVVRTPAFTGAIWPRVKPFALVSSDQFRPAPPAALGSSLYDEQTRRIVEVQAALTDEQKVIAEYWADGPNSELPPGHWLLFATDVSERDQYTDDQDIKMFFALSNALADAAIVAWDAKRSYDSQRPITAVRYLLHGQTITGYGPLGAAGGLRQILAESWVPYQPLTFPTPAFPEHVSGHSAFSAAAAQVLRSFTGSDRFGAAYTKPARSLVVEPGLPQGPVTLQWPTFSAAAAQAGLSRIYGGIHFDAGNAAGQLLGRQVGAQAFARAQALWQGRA